MISKKRRHKGFKIPPPPTTGRAAFKGILHPLILGGQTIAPASIARASTTTPSNVDPYSQATVTIPDTEPGQRDYCKLSDIEQAWCDINPTFSWCVKAGLLSDDPKCVPNNIKCPPSQKWLDVMNDPDPHNVYKEFLKEESIMNGIDGTCVDAAMDAYERKIKESYDEWIKTRGCKLGYNQFGHDVIQNYARCPDEFKDAKLGDIKNIDREDSSGITQDFAMKLLQWIPDKPAFTRPYDY